MKQMLNKLKSKAGESLVESLAAILIFTMASIVMYTMVTTASDINLKAKEMDEKIQSQLVAVESGQSSYRSGEGMVSVSLGGEILANVKVGVYGGKNPGELIAYFVEP